jgi:hypothetical protein
LHWPFWGDFENIFRRFEFELRMGKIKIDLEFHTFSRFLAMEREHEVQLS